MRIYFDTEFTQFRDGELLAVGLVADDDASLVVEIHDAERHRRANDFCQAVVLTQFGSTAATVVADDAAAGRAIAAWLGRIPRPLELLYDYKLDWRFLEGALRAAGEWERLAPYIEATNVAHVATSVRCIDAHDAYFVGKAWPGRHHPLIDALALRERWREYERERTGRDATPVATGRE